MQTTQPMQPGAAGPGQAITPEMFTNVQPAKIGAPIATQALELRNPAVDAPEVATWTRRIQEALTNPQQLDSTIRELLATQERGLAIMAAAFSQIMAAPPTQPGISPVTEILNAIVRAYTAATEAPGPFQPGTVSAP